MGGGGGEDQTNLKFTPTWVVAVVCSVIVAVSFAVERFLHYGGKCLKKKNQKPLFQALQKIKEELMLMGFISLLLTVTEDAITEICVHPSWSRHMLPCKRYEKELEESEHVTIHFQTSLSSSAISGLRHLLSEEKTSSESASGYCTTKGKVPLISSEALHHLHRFIFVLAVVHVTVCVMTIVFGGARMRQWKHWEDSIAKETNPDNGPAITHVQQHDFIRGRFVGLGKNSVLLSWLQSFLKQFYGSVTKSDYETLRFGFIMTHWNQNQKFDFHRYMTRALEDDFKKVVGISWYLWIFVVIFLLLNVNGWHAYFWIAFIPFILLLAVGTKLEHVITQLAHEVAEKHAAVEGAIVVQPSDDHFWFHKPKFVLFLIHLIIFQNAFEIAFFFFIWVTYGFDSCIMGQVEYIVPRLFIGVFVQVLCSYSILPLYAIVTQMGTHYKAAIFNEHVQEGLAGWTQRVKKKKARKGESSNDGPSSGGLQLGSLSRKQTAPQHNPPNP